jgi:hypothetical protein
MSRIITVEVEVILSDKYDLDVLNDGVGGLADIIRDGLDNPKYDYLEDVVILNDTVKRIK